MITFRQKITSAFWERPKSASMKFRRRNSTSCRSSGTIRAQNAKPQVGVGLPALSQHYRQGVGLLAGGTTGAPDQQRTAALVARHKVRNCLLHQKFKMLRLPKEIGLIGTDNVE